MRVFTVFPRVRYLAKAFVGFASLLVICAALLPSLAMAQVINQEAKLVASAVAGANSGTSVSISGDTAVVGAPSENGGQGAAYVFLRDNVTGWALQQTLTANDGVAGDLFGASVSISGDNVAVGAAGRASNTGAVYTFNRSGTVWTQGVTLTATGGVAGDKLGYSVSIQGLTLVAGAPLTNVGAKAAVGSAYVFTSLNGGVTWTQQFHIQVTTGQAKAGDHLGWSVALSGNTVLVGAPDDDFGNKVDAGSVYVFVRNGAVWTQQTRINPGATAGTRVGASVALFSNTALLGADGAASAKGTAYVYSRSGTLWTLLGTLTASDGLAGDHFGAGVAISGSLAVVGAPLANATGAGSGKGYVFGLVGGVYQQVSTLVATDNAVGDNFGASMSLDAGRALVGSPLATTGANADNGAAYVFAVQPATTTTITNIAPEPSLTGQSYSVSVQVTTNPLGGGTPSGTVNVSDGNGGSCTVTLNGSGTGSCSLASSSAGTLSITGSYSGALLFGASVSDPVTHTVVVADTTTSIISDAPDPSLIGQTVTVFVNVAPVAPASGTPTGSVTITDDVDPTVTCTIPDVSVNPSCTLSFNSLGTSNLTAAYAGDAGYNPSTSAAESHTVTIPSGNHLAFVPAGPGDVQQGNRLSGVTVQIQDATNTVVSSDNTTQVTLSVIACGAPVTFGPVTVQSGVASFDGVGPHFYTLAIGLQLNANASGYATATSGAFNVVANASNDLIFSNGFDSCRL